MFSQESTWTGTSMALNNTKALSVSVQPGHPSANEGVSKEQQAYDSASDQDGAVAMPLHADVPPVLLGSNVQTRISCPMQGYIIAHRVLLMAICEHHIAHDDGWQPATHVSCLCT
jgi:hypothetical protein